MTMEKAKQAEQATAAVGAKPKAKASGPLVYCGPSVKNVVKQFTVYSGADAVPAAVNEFLTKVPAAKGLMVPLDRFGKTRADLENPKSGAGLIFASVKAAIAKK